MSKSTPNILFVLPNASRTGAPIVALHFFKWLKKNTNCEFSIIIKADGDLFEAYKSIAPTYIWNPQLPYRSIVLRGILKICRGLGIQYNRPLPSALRKQDFDLIYGHTVVTLDVFSFLKKQYGCKLICHVHENEFSTKNYFQTFMVPSTLSIIDHFIGVSDSTIENLIKNYQIPVEKISKCYEFIDTKQQFQISKSKEAVYEELGVSSNNFIVGACGLTTWRKGVDLFIQLAAYIRRKQPSLHIQYLWVGHIDTGFQCYVDYELSMLGLSDTIVFTGSKPDPFNYFQLFDVFTLTSREDPFPLVALEAASMGIPVLCFEKAGGIPELVNKGIGYSYPYGAVDEMGDDIINMYHQKMVEYKNINYATNTSILNEVDVSVLSPIILKVIEKVIAIS